MPCCGNARNPQVESASLGAEASASDPAQGRAAYFQYFGKTRLTVIGGATRKLYRFDGPAARAIVDPRDAPSLSAIPMLRRL